MTIKELCYNTPRCDDCPFKVACNSFDIGIHPVALKPILNETLTKSIIETAKILTESEV